MELKFCPHCGKESLTFNGRKFFCSSCNFVLYHNVAGAVAVILRYKDEILLTKRNQEPASGKLDLAGGFIDPVESAEETCTREIKEELNIDIPPSHFKYIASYPNVYQYKEIDYNTIDLFYVCELQEKPNFNLELHEISSTVWIKEEDINLEDIAFDSQKNFFLNYRFI